MKEFFRPLFIFVSGNLVVLFLFLFFSAFGDAQTALEADTVGWAGWGWTWIVSSTRWLIFIIAEGLILFAVAKSFLGLKKG